MTFGEMTNNVYRLMRDTLHTKYDLATIRQWLNEGERKYCNRTGYSIKKDSTILTQADVTEYEMPSGCKELIGVFLDKSKLYRIEIENTIEEAGNTGIPIRYYIRQNNIGLYPTPETDGAEILVLYRALGGDMQEAADEPIIPIEHHYIPVWWACYLCSVEGDDTRSQHFYHLYESSIQEAITDVTHKMFPMMDDVCDTGTSVDRDYNRLR